MKTIKLYLAFLLIIGIAFNANCQFNYNSVTPSFSIGQTDATVDGIGIGTWPTNTATNARLHVNNFYTSLPTGGLNGLLFRTDGDSTVLNRWQMFTGTTAANASEKGMIFCDKDSLNFSIQATTKDLTFHTRPLGATGVGTERMRIVGVTHPLHNANAITTYIVREGYVGIGTLTPKAKLEIANGDIAVVAIGKDIMLNAANGNKFYCITIDNMNNFNTKGGYL
ncbi:MAG: hypothetical protein WCP85_31790 [Mariniphaga sp.]